MKVSNRRVQMWVTLFCMLTALVSVFVFVGSSRAEGGVVNDVVQEGGMEMHYVAGVQSKEIANPTCLDNYESWQNSSYEKVNVDWNTNFLVPYSSGGIFTPLQQFIDINGDGLLDYLYVNNQSQVLGYQYAYSNYGSVYNHILVDGVEDQDQKWRYKDSCVYLNNGAGWDLVYRCVVRPRTLSSEKIGNNSHSYSEPVFYGDCADVS